MKENVQQDELENHIEKVGACEPYSCAKTCLSLECEQSGQKVIAEETDYISCGESDVYINPTL